MKKNNKTILFLKILAGIVIVWGITTLIAESSSKEKTSLIGKKIAKKNALIVYDPDPFYNLDEQVCLGFAEGLSTEFWLAKIVTVSAAYKLEEEFDLYVFCTNTYNYAPDWAISTFIKRNKDLKGKPVVAITLGAGSTDRAQRLLEEKIKAKNANLIDSKTFWLMRPNDESRMEESNVKVAVDMARAFGTEVGKNMEEGYSLVR